MNARHHFSTVFSLLSFALLFSQSSGAEAAEAVDPLRVSYLQGELFVRGPFDAEEWPASLNTVLREGDQLRTSDDAIVELELPRATFVRLSGNAVASIQNLGGGAEIMINGGAAYLSHGPDAPDSTLISRFGGAGTAPKSIVRVDVEADEKMIVRVADGRVETTFGQNASTLQR